MKKSHLAASLMLFASCLGLSAQTETTYERGATYLERTLPPPPEPASITKFADVPFTHSTGMAEYDVPFYTLQGRELSIPIGLHYASGGIKLDEIAGVAGLGWTLQAGGCITRTVIDMPDEFSAPGFRHELPFGSLLDELVARENSSESLSYLTDIVSHKVDSHLDIYSYSVCGLRGSFVIEDDRSVFHISGDGVKIGFQLDDSGSIDNFTLTGPDGTAYVMSERETGIHEGRLETMYTPTSGQPDRWSATVAWHVTEVISRSGLEKALFRYSSPREWRRTVYAPTSIAVSTVEPGRIPTYSVRNTGWYVHNAYETKVLENIELEGFRTDFSYSAGTGRSNHGETKVAEHNYPFRLTGISVRAAGNASELCRLDVHTAREINDGRVILNGVDLYKGGMLEDTWEFQYNTVGKVVSRYSQDWFGYYNGQNEKPQFTADLKPVRKSTSLCPYEFDNQALDVDVRLVNGYPDPANSSYMSLKNIVHDGLVTDIKYEGNMILHLRDTSYVGVRVDSMLSYGMSSEEYIRSFEYDLPAASGPVWPEHHLYLQTDYTHEAVGISEEHIWQYTLNAASIHEGPSIQDTRVFYGKVKEYRSPLYSGGDIHSLDSVNCGICTSYEYDVSQVSAEGVQVSSRFPSKWRGTYDSGPSSCSPWLGVTTYYSVIGSSMPPLLTRKEEYTSSELGWKLLTSSEYVYDESEKSSVLIGYRANAVVDKVPLYGNVNYDDIYHYPVKAYCVPSRNPVRTVHVDCLSSGNDTTIVSTSYVLRNSISDPVRISTESISEGFDTRYIKYTYADTWEGDEQWPSVLAGQHFLSIPLKKEYRKTSQSPTGSVIPGLPGIVLPGNRPSVNDPLFGPADTLTLKFPTTLLREETVEYGWVEARGSDHLLPLARIEKTDKGESWREDYLTRNSVGAVTSVNERGCPETVILWGYKGLLPVAVIENTSMAEVQEAFSDWPEALDSLVALDSLPPAYGERLDGLRSALPDAHVTTYTHLPGIGVASVTDPAGMKTTFGYDYAGRLICIRDNDGNKIEEYDYSLMADENKRRHMRSRVFRSADGQQFSEDVRWWDVYGRALQDISIAASGDGKDLVTAYGSDFMFHDDVKTWLPYPVQNTAGVFQTSAESASAIYHGNEHAYSFKNYEISSRDRVLSTALPGYAGEHETTFNTDVTSGLPKYTWKNDSIALNGTYDQNEIVVEMAIDADGRTISVCRDYAGRTIATSNGTDTPTYYVYDFYDRLSAVMGSGVEMTDTLNMWRYDYDSLGRVASKGIPGSVREFYTYDDEDRVIAVLRDGVLKEKEYDAMGRVIKVWQTLPGEQRKQLEEHTYDTYPAGVNGADPKGLKTSSRLTKIAPDGGVTGYARVTYSYDDRKRPVKVMTKYAAGEERIDEMEYTFTGEVSSYTSSYIHGNKIDVLTVDYTYDQRGRLKVETATLTPSGSAPQTAKVIHSYDAIGRPSETSSLMLNCPRLASTCSYTLQGWTDNLSVTLGNSPLFLQNLGYYATSNLSGHVPQYSGMVSMKTELWPQTSAPTPNTRECYVYDHAGRLAKSGRQGSFREYAYDSRGNILSETLPGSSGSFSYEYDGDRLRVLVSLAADAQDTVVFTHDALGRMTFDGTTGQSMTYNCLDLVGNVSKDGTTLVKYSYLSDGTKLSALDGSGEGLVYRGPFVYRNSSGSSSLTLESAAFGGGRLTPDGALLYVRDYLGSVRAVVDGKTGELYKAAKYSAFGDEDQVMIPASVSTPPHQLATAVLPAGLTLRDAYTGKEAQNPDFSTGYTDFGARQYSPALRRWMTPDPLSEKYYGVSPYAFCNNNPVNFVDPDGEFPMLSNLVGAFVSAGVEYGSQVIGNFFSYGFSADIFTNVDLFDIGVAFGEGFITSGTNVVRKVVAKSAIGLAGEVARNALDVQIKDGEVQTPVVNSFGEVLTDTAIGVASETIRVDVNITTFKGVSNTQIVRAAREAASAKGTSLSSQAADGIRKSNAKINAEKSAANQAVSEGVGSVPTSVAGELLNRLNDED